MPSYPPMEVDIRLSATSLAETTTRSIEKSKGPVAAAQSEEASAKLKESRFLHEENVEFPGDERRFVLNFLKNVPFKQVHVGGGLWNGGIESYEERGACVSTVNIWLLNGKNDEKNDEKNDGSGEGQHACVCRPRAHHTLFSEAANASSLTNDPIIPKALVLHVLHSNVTFLRNSDGDKYQRLMIDVFFNGTLASSALVNREENNQYHQVFAGTRVEIMAERPWVILPPGQNADGSLRGLQRTISVKERWEQICKALMEEVRVRGVNDFGERPPSADYLYTLANMEMSEQVERLQQRGGRSFGVIDVVVTAGDGKKMNQRTPYLKKPTRMVDERYKMEEEQAKSRKPRATEQDAEGETDEEFEHEVEREFEQESLTPAASTPWSTMPLSRTRSQLLQMTNPQPSAPVFPPFSVALPGLSSADSQLMFDYFSRLGTRRSQLDANPFDTSSLSDPIAILDSADTNLLPSHDPQVSFGHANIASDHPKVPPSEASIGLGITGTKVLPGPGMPTGMRPFAHTGFGGPQLGPPPPVGFFSVSSKLEDKFHVIGHTEVDPDLLPVSFLLSCLVITGKNGKRIVDHKWSVAQRIVSKKGRLNQQHLPTRPSSKIRNFSLGSAEYKEASAGSRRGSRSNHRLTTPPTSSPRLVDAYMTMSVDKTKRDSIHDSQVVRNPGIRPTIDPALASISRLLPPGIVRQPNKDNIESSMDDSMAILPNTPAVFSRQATSQPLLNVQKPKVRPFMFEDTEEILRRNVGLPTEPGSSSVGLTPHPSQISSILGDVETGTSTLVNPSSTPDIFNPSRLSSSLLSRAHNHGNEKATLKVRFVDSIEIDSSDLSSAPNSPEVTSSTMINDAHAENASASQFTASAQPSSVVETPVPSQTTKQDEAYPSSRKRRHTSFLSTAPASLGMALSQNHTIIPTPMVSGPLSSLFISPVKPSPKKKRRTTKPPLRTRECYRPTGLASTTDNPPLNQDCSIAFAVTGMNGIEGTGSVLRQVKSERQGMFTEEEVVVGMRFFVPG